ncbi:MAG: zf-HC2 domain-containing protein [Treponema sp.]|jgi:hypothetical protein|nr:zf-HC2 domain-containing protein [Treponema sp.]
MCPDRQILSVYFDGELDSPWKEKCEKHLEICPSCRKRLERYGLTRQGLAGADEPALAEAMNRVWDKTFFAPEHTERKRRSGLWTASITVPFPAAAAAGLVMALALGALIVFRGGAPAADPQLAGLEVQDMAPGSDMASLLQYLGSENSPDMVIIRLPDTTFKNAGEPQMLRAADYSRALPPERSGGSP